MICREKGWRHSSSSTGCPRLSTMLGGGDQPHPGPYLGLAVAVLGEVVGSRTLHTRARSCSEAGAEAVSGLAWVACFSISCYKHRKGGVLWRPQPQSLLCPSST